MGNVFVSTDFTALTTRSDKVSSGYLNLFAALSFKEVRICFPWGQVEAYPVTIRNTPSYNGGPPPHINSGHIITGKILTIFPGKAIGF